MTYEEVTRIVADALGVERLSVKWAEAVARFVAGKRPRSIADAYVDGYVRNYLETKS